MYVIAWSVDDAPEGGMQSTDQKVNMFLED